MPSAAFKRIMAGLEEALEHAKGNTPPGTRIHHVPVGNVDVAELRAKLGLSQSEFAQGFGVPKATVQNWEQGRRKPQGPAHVLLHIIENDPEHVIKLLWPQTARRAKGSLEEIERVRKGSQRAIEETLAGVRAPATRSRAKKAG